ncbi:hypothetical protein [Pseudomonas grimontii]|nr:hypothetical protein [Pseudomonas grimontii]
MLTLKMMGSEDLADSHPSKSFTLVHLANRSSITFGRGPGGIPEIQVADIEGEIETFSPAGNTYVLEGGKTVATFAHMPPPEHRAQPEIHGAN